MLFSVIIPTYNRPKQISRCLKSLNNQLLNYHEWEVIVVDDGSREDIKTMIENLPLNYSCVYFYQENSGPATARNSGVSRATGRYLVFIDDDCEADRSWLVNLKKNMEPGTLYGGRTINKLSANIFSETSQLLVNYLYKTLMGTPLMFFTTNNFAIDRESFLGCGAFNTEFPLAAGEDREFSIRYRHLGYKLKYAPDALVLHSHRHTFRSFLRQHFNYGRSSHIFRVIMKKLGVNLYIDDTWFFVRLIFYPLKNNDYPRGEKMALTCLLGVTQIVYAAGYLYELLDSYIDMKSTGK